MQSIIVSTIYLLTIFIPLTFTTINSELFEFPKFILLLSGTLVITAAWALHIYKTKDYTITRARHTSPLHISILAILLTQTIATIFSIHPYTSFWGYYSRFHGGLITTICYTIIYFATIKWMDTKSTQKLIKISIITAILVGLYAIAQRLGIDKNFWVQDVQNRPFSTLGQPNWLAAYLLPNIFLSIYLLNFSSSGKKTRDPSKLVGMTTFAILFIALLFTKSRSGLLAFGFSFITYWLLLARQFSFAKIKHDLIRYSLLSVSILLIIGTPYSPSLASLLHTQIPDSQQGGQENLNTKIPTSGTSLESGGTESGDIRKIVWTGALNLIKKYPILGTGPETFAYTYYWQRPITHNLTSEWDFLYNKAHNEYLNIAAGTGLIGLLAYLYFHFAVITQSLKIIPKSKKMTQEKDNDLRHLYPVLGASIVAFTITNFFGFSVIPVYLMMMLVAAIGSSHAGADYHPPASLSSTYLLIFLVLVYPIRLFLADIYYARGKASSSIELLQNAIAIRPKLDLFHSQKGEIYASQGQKDLALQELIINKKQNPYHLNYYKSRAKIYLTLATIEPSYHLDAAEELVQARKLAPTDPKLAYNLGLIYTRLDMLDLATKELQDAISLKPNYQEPYYALTLLYEQTKQVDKIPELLAGAKSNLSTYSAQLKQKLEKYTP